LLRRAVARRTAGRGRTPPPGLRPAGTVPLGDRRRAPGRRLRASGEGRRGGGAHSPGPGAEARAARLPARPPADRPAADEGTDRLPETSARAVAARVR